MLYQNASTLNFQHFGSFVIAVSTIGISVDSKMCCTYASEHKIMSQNGSGSKGVRINYIAQLGGTVLWFSHFDFQKLNWDYLSKPLDMTSNINVF